MRLTRKNINPFRDIGFDGMARKYDEKTGKYTYFGIQSKHHKSSIGMGKIGTFYIKQRSLFRKDKSSIGYLYHISKLSITLRHELKDAKACEGFVIINHNIEDEFEYSSITAEDEYSTTISEIDYILLPHQDENLNDLKSLKGKVLYNAICGSGKTVVCGHLLRHLLPKTIIVLAPLRITVENLYTRFPPFLEDYEILIVDSDNVGTTDENKIRNFLNNDKNKVIFTTFKSAKDILSDILEYPRDYQYIIIDECHNVTPKKVKLIEFINRFENGLGLTATPYNNIDQVINFDGRVTYSFTEGIEQGVICDYQIWLPLITDEEDLPIEVKDLPEDLTKKSLFLSNSMLQTGSRKCIVYCANIQECNDFANILPTGIRKISRIRM